MTMGGGFDDDDEWDDFSVAAPPPGNSGISAGENDLINKLGNPVQVELIKPKYMGSLHLDVSERKEPGAEEMDEEDLILDTDDKIEAPPMLVSSTSTFDYDSSHRKSSEALTDKKPVVETVERKEANSDYLDNLSYIPCESSDGKTNEKENKETLSIASPLPSATRRRSEADSMLAALEKVENEHLQAKIKALKNITDSLAKDKEILQLEVKAMQDKCSITESLKGELEKQKVLYRALQEKHQQKLSELKKAGSESLAVVVEDYKAQTRQCLLEERAESKGVILEYMEKQSSLIQTSNESKFREAMLSMDEEKEDMLEEVKQAAKNDIVVLQERFQSDFELEKQKWKKCFREEFDLQCGEFKSMVKTLVEKEVESNKSVISEFKDESLQILKEEEQKCMENLKVAVKRERDVAVSYIENALSEERERFDQTIKKRDNISKDVIELTSTKITSVLDEQRSVFEERLEMFRKEMEQKIAESSEKKEVDRKKALSSMSVFLENMQNQVSSLLDE